jgi:putative RNA 2'-phosphotransferase
MSRVGRRLARILRHEPEIIGLTLGPGGWVAVDDIVKAFKSTPTPIKHAQIEAIVSSDDKQRFSLSKDGRFIRAAQGHSVDVDLGLDAKEPPELLYHGTASSSLNSIFAKGIQPQRRRQVHLSLDVQTATKVGSRHGNPIVLLVRAREMHEQGHSFFQADNGVWLVGEVPVGWFELAAGVS